MNTHDAEEMIHGPHKEQEITLWPKWILRSSAADSVTEMVEVVLSEVRSSIKECPPIVTWNPA